MKLPAYPSIRELAAYAGLSKDTARRRIHALHDKHGGLLVDVGLKTKRVSAARYVELCAEFFGSAVATASELDFVEQRVARIEKRMGISLPF